MACALVKVGLKVGLASRNPEKPADLAAEIGAGVLKVGDQRGGRRKWIEWA